MCLLRLLTAVLLLLSGAAVPVHSGTNPTIAYIAFSEGFWQIWVMDPDGTRRSQVTRTPYDKSKLSWYPDGTHLLVNGSQGQLNKINIQTSGEVPVKLPLEGVVDAVLSPDGKQIAFSASVADAVDRNDIWLVDALGDNLRKLTRMQGLQHEPAWSSDGRLLYFLSGITGSAKQHHDLWQYELSSGALTQLTSGRLYHFDIDASAQGALVYSNNSTGDYEIWMKSGSGEVTRLTHSPGLDSKPSWSPDGKTVIFESTRSGVPNIWKLELESGLIKQLTDEKTGARHPAWFRQQGRS